MEFRIPFAISRDLEILKRRSKRFMKFTSPKPNKIDDYLKDTGANINRRQYLAVCYRFFSFNLLSLSVILTSILGLAGANMFYYYGLGAAFLISGFMLANQMNYPRSFSINKARNIERNLISVLQDMLVQLNSGVPIFRILVNISESEYEQVSEEFKKITKEISAGISQIDALEKYGKLTNSRYFKRVLWQLSNGMRAGSDMGVVIKEGIKSLSDEQAIQIQSYGGKLNPLIMFYMLIAIILPSLAITFLIIISSILSASESMVKLMFFGIFGFVLFVQMMFLGIIKSRRPSLL